jgi:hypothetical protein
MPDFGFVGASYTTRSIYQDDQECINFYPEIDPTKQPGERGIVALYPTPGLVTEITFRFLAKSAGCGRCPVFNTPLPFAEIGCIGLIPT